MQIKKEYIIEKRNVLNELRSNNMTLQELRFFSIYLSKINSRNIETRNVIFPLEDFVKIMDLGRVNINYLKQITNSLLSKIVNIPSGNRGGYTAFQLFKRCRVEPDEFGNWSVEINAHDEALPLMFDFKEKYFTYHLWNALSLKSTNQLRMYEVLKQYEKIGHRIIEISELRELLGVQKNEYLKFNSFRIRILDACQQALEESTDIKYTYEIYKRGARGKILSLKFKIYKNENYSDPLSLDDFIENQNIIDGEIIEKTDDEPKNAYQKRIEFISDACSNEFTYAEMELLYNLIMDRFSTSRISDDLKLYHYVQYQYSELKMRSEKTKIKHRFAYLRKIVEASEYF